MSTRQTALFACLFSMAFSAHADNFTCSRLQGTRPVAIASFSFTPRQLRQAAKVHSPDTCPIPVPRKDIDTREPTGAKSIGKAQPPSSLPNVSQAAGKGASDENQITMCGVVDGDPYHNAAAMAFSFCKAQSEGASAPNLRTAVAKTQPRKRGIGFEVARPASFNAKNHHTNYTFNDGSLVGTCYVCVADMAISVGQDTNVMAVPNDAPARPKDAQLKQKDTIAPPKDAPARPKD
jgi:hypothetical protein